MHEDRCNLWVGTGQGTVSTIIIPQSFHRPASYLTSRQRRNGPAFNANIITSDQNGHILVGSNGWGLMIVPAQKANGRQVPLIENGNINTGYNLRCIIGNLPRWFGCLFPEKGLYINANVLVKISPVNNEVKVRELYAAWQRIIIIVSSKKGCTDIITSILDRYYSEENE